MNDELPPLGVTFLPTFSFQRYRYYMLAPLQSGQEAMTRCSRVLVAAARPNAYKQPPRSNTWQNRFMTCVKNSKRKADSCARLVAGRQHITTVNLWSGDLASMPCMLLLATR